MLKHEIEEILNSSNRRHIDYMAEMFTEFLEELKVRDHHLYKRYKHKIHKMLYGNHLSREMADAWINDMDNLNGEAKGAHWSYEQTVPYAGTYDKNDFYATMNFMYATFYNGKNDMNYYANMAKNWLTVHDDKVLEYYLYVIC